MKIVFVRIPKIVAIVALIFQLTPFWFALIMHTVLIFKNSGTNPLILLIPVHTIFYMISILGIIDAKYFNSDILKRKYISRTLFALNIAIIIFLFIFTCLTSLRSMVIKFIL